MRRKKSKALVETSLDFGEERAVDNLEVKNRLLRLMDQLLPLLETDARVGDVVKMLERTAPVAMLRMVDLLTNSSSEKVQATVAKDLLYMAGHKPVEKSVDLTRAIDMMQETQLDAYLQNAVKNMGIQDREKIIHLIQTPDGFVPATEEIASVLPTDLPKHSL